MLDRRLDDFGDQERLTALVLGLLSMTGRIEQLEEVAALVSFLGGPDSRYITGEAFNGSGGILAPAGSMVASRASPASSKSTASMTISFGSPSSAMF